MAWAVVRASETVASGGGKGGGETLCHQAIVGVTAHLLGKGDVFSALAFATAQYTDPWASS